MLKLLINKIYIFQMFFSRLNECLMLVISTFQKCETTKLVERIPCHTRLIVLYNSECYLPSRFLTGPSTVILWEFMDRNDRIPRVMKDVKVTGWEIRSLIGALVPLDCWGFFKFHIDVKKCQWLFIGCWNHLIEWENVHILQKLRYNTNYTISTFT